MIGWLERVFRRRDDDVRATPADDLDAARREHHRALQDEQRSLTRVDRVLVERERINEAMRAADVSMFGERLEGR